MCVNPDGVTSTGLSTVNLSVIRFGRCLSDVKRGYTILTNLRGATFNDKPFSNIRNFQTTPYLKSRERSNLNRKG